MNGATLWAAVTVAGGCGAVMRLHVDETIRNRTHGDAPVGIFVVNLTGALLLGILTGAALPHHTSLITATAFVGAYTTFSTWMLDTIGAASRHQATVAASNLVGSVACGLAAAAIGRQIGVHL
jgi:CrcB protein